MGYDEDLINITSKIHFNYLNVPNLILFLKLIDP